MKDFYRSHLIRPFIIYLTISFALVSALPTNSLAAFIPSLIPQELSSPSAAGRDAGIDSIQKLLESKVVSQRLSDFGLSPEEIKDRLDQLTDEEVHFFASQLDSLDAGGDFSGAIIGLLLIIVLVLVILRITGHKIVVE